MTWLSFADPHRPKGSQFLGVAIVQGLNADDALANAWTTSCNPGGEVTVMTVLGQYGDPPLEYRYRLISDRNILDKLTEIWIGGGCETVAEYEERTTN